jgi:hypothetical protein
MFGLFTLAAAAVAVAAAMASMLQSSLSASRLPDDEQTVK